MKSHNQPLSTDYSNNSLQTFTSDPSPSALFGSSISFEAAKFTKRTPTADEQPNNKKRRVQISHSTSSSSSSTAFHWSPTLPVDQTTLAARASAEQEEKAAEKQQALATTSAINSRDRADALSIQPRTADKLSTVKWVYANISDIRRSLKLLNAKCQNLITLISENSQASLDALNQNIEKLAAEMLQHFTHTSSSEAFDRTCEEMSIYLQFLIYTTILDDHNKNSEITKRKLSIILNNNYLLACVRDKENSHGKVVFWVDTDVNRTIIQKCTHATRLDFGLKFLEKIAHFCQGENSSVFIQYFIGFPERESSLLGTMIFYNITEGVQAVLKIAKLAFANDDKRYYDYIHETNRSGFTPLATAISNKNREIAQLLIDAGADIDFKTNKGTPRFLLNRWSDHNLNLTSPMKQSNLTAANSTNTAAYDQSALTSSSNSTSINASTESSNNLSHLLSLPIANPYVPAPVISNAYVPAPLISNPSIPAPLISNPYIPAPPISHTLKPVQTLPIAVNTTYHEATTQVSLAPFSFPAAIQPVSDTNQLFSLHASPPALNAYVAAPPVSSTLPSQQAIGVQAPVSVGNNNGFSLFSSSSSSSGNFYRNPGTVISPNNFQKKALNDLDEVLHDFDSNIFASIIGFASHLELREQCEPNHFNTFVQRVQTISFADQANRIHSYHLFKDAVIALLAHKAHNKAQHENLFSTLLYRIGRAVDLSKHLSDKRERKNLAAPFIEKAAGYDHKNAKKWMTAYEIDVKSISSMRSFGK